MANGLYVTSAGEVMVDYGTRAIPISPAQYRANGYKPPFEKLIDRSLRDRMLQTDAGRSHPGGGRKSTSR
jgi:hypothetical protein